MTTTLYPAECSLSGLFRARNGHLAISQRKGAAA